MTDEERLIELETRLTFQEDLLDTLNHIVAEQQQELMQLKDLCRDLLQQLRQMPEPGAARRPEDEVPPHY